MATLFYRIRNPRKTHIYGVGTGKSGTHTIAKIWGNQFTTAHEPESECMLGWYLDWESGQYTENEIIGLLKEQDKRLWLEINSSAVNFLFIDLLQKIFPRSKYILTIRNPYSWLDSFFNHQLLSQNCSANWQKMRKLRFRPDLHTHPKEETVLKANNLYTLDGYLSYWYHHNKKVINTVPGERLLIVRTDQIEQKHDQLASFAGLKNSAKMLTNCREFPARQKFNILDQLDPDYLNHKIKQHCSEFMEVYFPETESYQDVFLT